MFLTVEILLTISVWRKGWAVVPVGLAVIVGLLIGAVAQESGGLTEDMVSFAFVVDLVAVLVLVVLASKAPCQD